MYRAGTKWKSNILLKKDDVGISKPASTKIPQMGTCYGIKSKEMKPTQPILKSDLVHKDENLKTRKLFHLKNIDVHNFD